MAEDRNIKPAQVILVLIVLAGVAGSALSIFRIINARASLNKPVEPVAQAPREQSRPARRMSPAPEPEPVVQEDTPQPVEPPQQREEPVTQTPAAPPAPPAPQSFTNAQPMGAGGQMWQEAFGDLQMTDEEQERFRQGMSMAMQRFWSMSQDERQAEMERMRQMGERWQAMSDSERQAAISRMRERFDEWRTSGEIELPQPSLD